MESHKFPKMSIKESDDIEESEVLKEIWVGKIPVMFSLSSNDNSTSDTPHPVYSMVPRISYLTNNIEDMRNQYEQYVSKFENKGDLWYSSHGVPLRWKYPVGVLFDLYTENHSHSKVSLPWEINVHFLSFPSEKIQKFSDDKERQWNFMNSLKTGMYLKYGDVQKVMTLPTTESTKLWQSIKFGDFEMFTTIQKTHLEPFSIIDQKFKRYSIYLCWLNKSSSSFSEIETKLESLSKEEIEKKMTLGMFRNIHGLEKKIIIVQGIIPSDDTEMEWLCKMCSHPDRICYFVIKDSNS